MGSKRMAHKGFIASFVVASVLCDEAILNVCNIMVIDDVLDCFGQKAASQRRMMQQSHSQRRMIQQSYSQR
ncbi:MAG: hypothetical protein A3E85_02705 [Gammaproteobacteria bacterium RIFCSPHIGHO2_12_FULL_45_12]|nr:MAG: hypothetical protein A3E85_02705 [Gammaproteobacteria bacterium RIFCSPHIGHO2_12_FULL_45_12]